MGRTPYKYRIKLSGKEKKLRQAKRKGCKKARLIIRILIILWAGKGKTIAQTAELLGCCEQTVLNWRERFLERRSEGPVAALMDLPRSGRPVTYGAQERAQVVAVVCEILYDHKKPLSRFSITDLHRIVVKEEGLADLSHGSLARILAENTLKPWQYSYWLFPRDPDFVSKACVVLDLYAGFWEGQRLGPDEYVLAADEKTIQVLVRRHPGLAAIPGYEQRVEFEYKRLGTVAYTRPGMSSEVESLDGWPPTRASPLLINWLIWSCPKSLIKALGGPFGLSIVAVLIIPILSRHDCGGCIPMRWRFRYRCIPVG